MEGSNPNWTNEEPRLFDQKVSRSHSTHPISWSEGVLVLGVRARWNAQKKTLAMREVVTVGSHALHVLILIHIFRSTIYMYFLHIIYERIEGNVIG